MLSLQDSPCYSTLRELGDIVANILLYMQIPIDAPTRTKFQQFKSNPILFLFKKLNCIGSQTFLWPTYD